MYALSVFVDSESDLKPAVGGSLEQRHSNLLSIGGGVRYSRVNKMSKTTKLT